ncbi:hypothetical protein BGZ83_010878 [Gryganskiella cystojenkinii]|nr:hypothetical protein BGZ83_010878 [Gryganskiella cystojenkinii]
MASTSKAKRSSSTQQQRHQLLRDHTTTGTGTSSEGGGFIVEGETNVASPSHRGIGRRSAGSGSGSTSTIPPHAQGPLPTDTSGAIDYLLDLLQPTRVRQQKVFPRVCMVHQIYSLLHDHTTVDRTVAQLIQEGVIRKFYIGGTGSDEFAIMRTPDYVDQILVAKEQYLQELRASASVETNRAAESSSTSGPADSNKRSAASDSAADTRAKRMSRGSTNASPTSRKGFQKKSTEFLEAELEHAATLFDRFRNLVTGGQCIEISIQHSNLQQAIDATDEDITVLIKYSLLTRSLAAPANPHLINLNNAPGRSTGGNNAVSAGGSSSNAGGGHSALNQLINATNQEQSKTLKAEVGPGGASGSAPTAPSVSNLSTPTAAASLQVVSAASGRRERISDDVAYRFAIRQGGLFVTHFLKGRLEILRMIKRQMFGDMLSSGVMAKPLRGSFLPHEFHIHDLVGSGRVQR